MGVRLPRYCPRCKADTLAWHFFWVASRTDPRKTRRVRICDTCDAHTKPSKARRATRTRTARAKLREECDGLASECTRIRAGGRCECGSPTCPTKSPSAHHVFGRTMPNTRYELDNLAWLSWHCHNVVQHDHEANRALGIRLVGPARYEELNVLAHAPTQRTDLRAVKARLLERRAQLMALQGAPREA